MTYLSGKTHKKRTYIRYALYGGIFLLVVIFWPQLRKSVYPVIEPVILRYGITKHSFSVFPEFFSTYITTHKTLAVKNKNLELEIERLENLLADTNADVREQMIGDSLDVLATSSKKTPLVMYPLMQDMTKLYSTVLLSKGFKDGVDIGDVAYIRGNQAVCAIKEVYNSSSLCLLLTAPGVITEGVTSSSSITISLTGRGGHYLANITRDTPISIGEIVYMRSNPRVIVGTVQYVSNNNQDTSWHVFVEGAYNPLTTSVFYVQP